MAVMDASLKSIFLKLYGRLLGVARKFILALHGAASGLALKDVILFSSLPDFSESTVETFNMMLKMEALKDYKFIWFCDRPRAWKHLESSRVIIKKRIDNPLLRLANLYCESTARGCVYSHQLLGNMLNDKQLRLHISHGSFGIKKLVISFNPQMNYDTYSVHTFLDDGKYRALGLPRNDRLFDDPAATRKRLGLEGYAKIIIWMPTFKHYQPRGWFHPPRYDFKIHKEYDITLQGDPAFHEETDEALKKTGTLLLIKYHPSQNMNYVSRRETGNMKIVGNETLAKAGVPLYSLLGATDALITDFSSVCYDYLLTDKPIGFDITDLELYDYNRDMGDPLQYMPGEKIRSAGDFGAFIKKVAESEDACGAARKELRDRLHVHQDDKSTERVAGFIVSELARRRAE